MMSEEQEEWMAALSENDEIWCEGDPDPMGRCSAVDPQYCERHECHGK